MLQAKGGELRGSKLTLRGVAPRVVSFADRPRRSAGSVPVQRFAGRWSSAFGTDPPNAALEVQGAPASRDVALVELRHPRYDARRHLLTYSVSRLSHTGDPALAEFDRRADGHAVRRFGRSSLFIDGGGGESSPNIVEVKVAAGATVSIHFTNTTVGYEQDGVFIAGINTPPSGAYGEYSNGELNLKGPLMTFQASSGGAGMRVQVLANLAPPSEGDTITGIASIPPGCEASITPPGGKPKVLPSGPFSAPFE